MENSWNPLQNAVNNNIGEGALADALGNIAMGGVNQLSKWLPDEIGSILTKGFQKADFGQLFGDAFQDVLYNRFYKVMIDSLQKIGEVASKSWEKADQAAYTYGKRIGLTSDQVKRLRDDVISLNDATAKFGINYGKTLDEVIKLQSEFSSQLGRSVKLTNDQLQDIAALSAVVGDDMAVKFAAQLDSFGVSTNRAGELMTAMFNKSVKQGISLEAYSKNVNENLHLAQQYTFKRGVDGLTSMAENAAKMKLDMQQVVALANKVSDVESAVNMSAELQVLGGPFTQFADPLGLLHDSLLDMEGLSDRLTGLIGEMGYFNKETGKVDINPFNQIRLREASKSMGLDYGKLVESATQQAKRKEVESQMVGLSNIPEEYKELIMNTAQFQNGMAGVRGADGKFKNLASLNGNDLKSLANFAKTDSENIRDIAQILRGMTDMREGMEKEKENERAALYRTQSEYIKGMYQDLGESKEALQRLVKIEISQAVMETVSGHAKQVGSKVIDLALSVATKGKVKTHAEGGVITNGQQGKEYILNSAQQGEFIVNKSSVEQYLPLLNLINGDKDGSLLTSLFKPDEFLNSNEDIIRGFIENRTSALRKERDALTRELKNLDVNSREYERLLKRRENISSKWGKNMALMNKKSSAYNNQMAKLAKGIKIGTTVGGSALAGIGALTTSIQSYRSDGTMVMNHGKAVGGTIGASAGAAIGTALGAFAGPIGMMVGGAIGQYAGKAIGETIGEGNKGRRSRMRTQLASEISSVAGSNKFMSLQGDFSVKEMRQIAKALDDGKLWESEIKDEKIIQKLKETGNANMFAKKYKDGGLLNGNSHANGGIKFSEAEGGEFIVNKNSTASSLGILRGINDGKYNDANLKPIEPMGKQMKVKESFSTNNPQPQNIKMEPVNININGTIKLDTGDRTFDISKELLNNPTLINKLTDIITKQMNIDEHFMFNRKEYKRKYSSI